ncbi:MAG TPA: hypothetical protein VHG28_03735 [Longimicrobiaceae bacterium]|nr:hypothetical protein [Longimicrobiaceae bacterium]
MGTDDREKVRAVNPARRRDEPRRDPSPREGAGEEGVKVTQGEELDPRGQGGLNE